MKTIGIRELRQQASKYLRDVESGETLEVTDRGRPVARLVPVGKGDPLDDLAASGRLVRANADLLKLGAPLQPARGRPLPGNVLSGIRAEER